MKIAGAVVLITGANRGIGLAFAQAALARGAKKVYAGARDPASVKLAGVEAVKLDVTSDSDVSSCAAHCADTTLVINNAGIGEPARFLEAGSMETCRRYMETNFFGMQRVSFAFAPILAANGGGAMINVLSVASWAGAPMLSIYAASKSAAWGLTNAFRRELREQNTHVLALHMGFVATDLTQNFDVPKASPESIVKTTFDGLEAGAEEVLADERAQLIKRGLSSEPGIYITGAPPVAPPPKG
jgi:NAD(P)-dependent dehydrogenase (short-subunit alcohol dehydrogenase family)